MIGAMLLASTSGAGVDVSRVRQTAEPTGVAVISVDGAGENSIIIAAGANGTLAPAHVDPAAFAAAAVVSLCLEVPLQTVQAAAQADPRIRLVEQRVTETGLAIAYLNRVYAVLSGINMLIVRATDSRGETQPQTVRWNAKGYLFNAWHHVPVKTS